MKKVIFILIICSAIYSCVKNESKDVLDDLLVSYMAIMYNYGPSYTLEEIETFAEQSSYDDDVLEYYHYFCGKIELEDVKLHEKAQIYDQRIKDYIKQHLQKISQKAHSIYGIVMNGDIKWQIVLHNNTRKEVNSYASHKSSYNRTPSF